MTLTVAMVQSRTKGRDPEVNTAAGIEYMRRAAAHGADIVLFPECWITSYSCPVSPDDPDDYDYVFPSVEELERNEDFKSWVNSALPEDSEYIRAFCRAARELGIGAVITGFTRGESAPQNSAFLIDRSGRVVLKYSKVHTCDFWWERYLESGKEFGVGEFDGVKIGIMICYDREYPESARELALGGAELILVPNDCGAMPARLMELEVRAMENMVGVAMANPPGDGMGRSCAYDPRVWDFGGVSAAKELACADELYEGFVFAAFDIDAIREYRRREDMGKYRKPGAYKRMKGM